MHVTINIMSAHQSTNYFEPQGFMIPGRELTEAEQTQPITVERFMDWMAEVGEDYIDQCPLPAKGLHMFVGFVLAKRPTRAKQLIDIVNNKYGDAREIKEIIYEMDADGHMLADTLAGETQFYADFAEFVNLTDRIKAQVNANLILVMDDAHNETNTDDDE